MSENRHAPPDATDPAARAPDCSGEAAYRELHQALDRARDAYQLARPVFDRYPGGLPPREGLPDGERALLDELLRADVAVKRLREHRRMRFFGSGEAPTTRDE